MNLSNTDKIVSYPLICLSHLRRDSVYQRPQHSLSRFARRQPVYYLGKPIYGDAPTRLDVSRRLSLSSGREITDTLDLRR